MSTDGERSRFDLSSQKGDRGFFLHSSERGMVLGVKNHKAIDDHMTLVVRDGEFKEAHRKKGGQLEWSCKSEDVQRGIRELVGKAEVLNPEELKVNPTYIVSLSRANVAMELVGTFAGVWFRIIGRHVVRVKMTETKGRRVTSVRIDEREARRLMDWMRKCFSPFAPPMEVAAKTVLPKLARRMSRWFLLNPSDVRALRRDVGFMVAENKTGLLWLSKESRLSFLPVTTLTESYRYIEDKLPLGELAEFADLFGPGAEMTVQSG